MKANHKYFMVVLVAEANSPKKNESHLEKEYKRLGQKMNSWLVFHFVWGHSRLWRDDNGSTLTCYYHLHLDDLIVVWAVVWASRGQCSLLWCRHLAYFSVAECVKSWRTEACQTRSVWRPWRTNWKRPGSWLKRQTENTTRYNHPLLSDKIPCSNLDSPGLS